jgi:hypothetical protein
MDEEKGKGLSVAMGIDANFTSFDLKSWVLNLRDRGHVLAARAVCLLVLVAERSET